MPQFYSDASGSVTWGRLAARKQVAIQTRNNMGDEIKEKDSQLDQEPTDAGKDMIEEAYAYEGIFPCTPPTIPGIR